MKRKIVIEKYYYLDQLLCAAFGEGRDSSIEFESSMTKKIAERYGNFHFKVEVEDVINNREVE